MPTRTQIIDALKSRYDAQITGAESALIEPALLKLLICQLVDKVFGGDSASGTATELRQIDGNNFLSLIEANTNQLPNALTEILAELRDDTFVSESVWFDSKDVLSFYIRRLTIDQDTQTPIIAWWDKDGNPSSPNVSLLIQGNATTELQTEIVSQINAINGISQQIQANQQNQLTSQITQSQVVAAIQSAADIDTLITRLTSIDNKTVAAAPNTKTTIVGFTSVAAANNNLLDPTGNGAWTDVRAYQSCELTIATGASSVTLSGAIGAIDATGVSPAAIAGFNPSNGVSNAATSLGSNTTTKTKYDLTGVNFIRMGLVSATAGCRVTGIFSGFATTNQVSAQIAGTVPVLPVGNTTITALAPQSNVELTGVITATSSSASFTTPVGQSYQSTINVLSITGALAQSIVRIQESSDGGTNWRTVYTFEPITVANGARQYKSPLITATGNRIRYIETITGTTPSINRTVVKSTINAPGLVNQDTRSITVYNANLASIDVPAYGIIKAMSVFSTLATPIWLQIHDSIAPVAPGAQPRQSIRIPVDGLILGSAYFGGGGRQLGSAINPRIAVSTTANTYTQINQAADTVQVYIEAI